MSPYKSMKDLAIVKSFKTNYDNQGSLYFFFLTGEID